ncbi:hypothetical protein NL676_031069 [Syzygium grande]|nr:hypothetical protein NL676_031069 [Syzygium grande]
MLAKQTADPTEAKTLDCCAKLYFPVVSLTLPLAADALIRGRYRFVNCRLADGCDAAAHARGVIRGRDRVAVDQ